jgi:amino acid permease
MSAPPVYSAGEKHEEAKGDAPAQSYPIEGSNDEEVGVVHKGNALKTDLRSRHMQMIAIGIPLCF